MSYVKCQMLNVNKVKLLSQRTSGAPLVIFRHSVIWDRSTADADLQKYCPCLRENNTGQKISSTNCKSPNLITVGLLYCNISKIDVMTDWEVT